MLWHLAHYFFLQPGRRTSVESSSPSATQGQSDGNVLDPRAIAYSSVHYDSVSGNGGGLRDALGSDIDGHRDDAGASVASRLTRSRVIQYASEVYGVSEAWVMWLIGTTYNEDYFEDRYLQYAWACEILNCYTDWSVDELDCIWGSYYSIEHAFSGYYIADEGTLEMVWQAMTDLDTRIVEVDGMIDYYVEGYYLIYDSPWYDCQVWGKGE